MIRPKGTVLIGFELMREVGKKHFLCVRRVVKNHYRSVVLKGKREVMMRKSTKIVGIVGF